MFRALKVLMAAGVMSLTACDTDTKDEVDDTDAQVSLQPEAGDWTVVTEGWNNDNCNAEEAFTDVVMITFSNVDESSFAVTLFEDGDVRVGNSFTCSHTEDDVFACEDFLNDVEIQGMDATVSIVGIPTVTLNSETDMAGQADATIDCTGAACSQLTGGMPFTGFPCTATYNWTAVFDG